MARNTLPDLRDHLMNMIEELRDPDPEHPIEMDKCRLVVDAARAITDMAKTEVALLKELKDFSPGQQVQSQFFPQHTAKQLGQ